MLCLNMFEEQFVRFFWGLDEIQTIMQVQYSRYLRFIVSYSLIDLKWRLRLKFVAALIWMGECTNHWPKWCQVSFFSEWSVWSIISLDGAQRIPQAVYFAGARPLEDKNKVRLVMFLGRLLIQCMHSSNLGVLQQCCEYVPASTFRIGFNWAVWNST